MRLLTSLIVGAFFVLGGVSAQAASQDFIKGFKALQSGDYAAAFKVWLPLAKQGDVDAQYNLGLMYYEGDGVDQDDVQAFKYWRLAAIQEHQQAQYWLGIMYDFGLGIDQNNINAYLWYTSSLLNSYQNDPNFKSHVKKQRDEIAAKMTATDISKAQTMAKKCMSSDYKNCGW